MLRRSGVALATGLGLLPEKVELDERRYRGGVMNELPSAGDAESEGMEGSRPRRERCEGVSGMSVIWSLALRLGETAGRSGSRAYAMLDSR
jgi:hypothetical protein